MNKDEKKLIPQIFQNKKPCCYTPNNTSQTTYCVGMNNVCSGCGFKKFITTIDQAKINLYENGGGLIL